MTRDWPLLWAIAAFFLPAVALIGEVPLPVIAGLVVALSGAWTIAAIRKVRREGRAGLWVLLIAPLGLMWCLPIVLLGIGLIRGVVFRERQTNVAKAEALRGEIEERFDVDAPQGTVGDFLRQRQIPFDNRRKTSYWIPVGQAPSPDWSCESVETGVVVSFTPDERFIEATVGSRGIHCL